MARMMKMISASMACLSLGVSAACSGGDVSGALFGNGKSWEAEYRYQIQGEKGQETVVLRYKGGNPEAVGSVKYRLKEGGKTVSERDVILEENGRSVSTFFSDHLTEPEGSLTVEVEWNKMKETISLKPKSGQ